MERLLMKPDTRSAAVTMLGKSVEYCSDLVSHTYAHTRQAGL